MTPSVSSSTSAATSAGITTATTSTAAESTTTTTPPAMGTHARPTTDCNRSDRARSDRARSGREPARTGGLALAGVTVRYPDGTGPDGTPRWVTAVSDADLAVAPGEFTALLGPSGSGKSTLLSVAAGLVAPETGTVRVAGTDLARLADAERTRVRREEIGIVFQQPNLLPSLTAVEQVQVTRHLAGVRGRRLRDARGDTLDLLDRVGLAAQADRRPHQLSGGQRQRVNIARALAGTPAVLLVDEPTSALDQERSAAIVALLRDLTASLNLATIMVTHDGEFATGADQVVRIRDGKVAAA